MLSRRMRLLTIAVPVTASLALAAPAAATGESKGEKAILKAAVITKADVPAEWTSKRRSPSSDAVKGIKGCKRINRAVSEANKDVPRARSRDFSDAAQPNRSEAQNTAYAFSDKKAARNFVSTFQGTAASTCFQALAAELARNLPVSTPPTVEAIPDLQGVGDEALGYEIAATYMQDIGAATLYADFVFVRVGRAAMAFSFSNVGARIPQGPDIVNGVVQRVTATEA